MSTFITNFLSFFLYFAFLFSSVRSYNPADKNPFVFQLSVRYLELAADCSLI